MIKIPSPVNSNEKFLYGVIERLDLIIELLGGKSNQEEAKVEVEPVKAPTRRKKQSG